METDDWLEENAARLKELRRERGLSRNLVADLAGVNVSQVSRVERGRDARLSTMLKIYAGLGWAVTLELKEACDESIEFIDWERQERLDRREEGLATGKRWR